MLCIAQTMLSQDVVRPSFTPQYSLKMAKHILKLFFTVGLPHHYSFSVPKIMAIFRRVQWSNYEGAWMGPAPPKELAAPLKELP